MHPLLILAKGQKLREFFEEVVIRGLTEYMEILFEVAVDTDLETMTEGVRDMTEMPPESKPYLERFIETFFEVSPESMERIAPFREALEKHKNTATHNAILRVKREDLSLLLESRFGSVPEALALEIDAINDVEDLNRLYRQALIAQTLEEISLPKS